VGEHLHDHINVVQVVSAPRLRETLGLSFGIALRAIKGIFEWRNKRTGMLTTNIAEAGGFIKSRPEERLPDLQLHFIIAKLVDHARKTVFGHGYSCHVCLLRPLSRGSVRLASADPAAAPLIDPNFFGERADMDLMIRGFKQLRQILQQPALAAFGGKELPELAAAQTDAQIEKFIRDQADTEYHPVGSCRMGPGPMDVVDHELRVHGLQGLRVVDASIMPRLVSGNTNAPTIMIAEKAADMIKAAAAASMPDSSRVDTGVASSRHETVGT
jgi:choline dehydrogenase-like flavoprotein